MTTVSSTVGQRIRGRILTTPVGDFAVGDDQAGNVRAAWLDDDRHDLAFEVDPVWRPELAAALERYFTGGQVDFALPTPSGPPFFMRCWDACRSIPMGQQRSYGELARLAGSSSGAARAAGQAMRRNPLPIIVPCHRVVGSDGGLHGYAGSTTSGDLPLRRKAYLLELERSQTEAPSLRSL